MKHEVKSTFTDFLYCMLPLFMAVYVTYHKQWYIFGDNDKKEPLAKQAALMYNLLGKFNRTQVPMCPQLEYYKK